jgi:beta-phosphoglucomutase-like phosphatase (HAD superfamily)
MNYKAMIFDLDGTIVDTTEIWSQANKILIERRGIEFTKELHTELAPRIHGMAMHKVVAVIKDVVKLQESIDELVKEKSHIAVTLYNEGITFIEGFETFHSTIHGFNIKKAIATNADDKTIQATEAALGLKKYFGEHIYGISAVDFVGKPEPAIYLHAAQKIGVDPQECIAIEDSSIGIAAAQSAGIFCIGINTGKNRELIKNANLIVDYYHEITAYSFFKQ